MERDVSGKKPQHLIGIWDTLLIFFFISLPSSVSSNTTSDGLMATISNAYFILSAFFSGLLILVAGGNIIWKIARRAAREVQPAQVIMFILLPVSIIDNHLLSSGIGTTEAILIAVFSIAVPPLAILSLPSDSSLRRLEYEKPSPSTNLSRRQRLIALFKGSVIFLGAILPILMPNLTESTLFPWTFPVAAAALLTLTVSTLYLKPRFHDLLRQRLSD